MASNKKIVIIGGGFGGLNTAKYLRNATHCEVLLIDSRNHHLFQPLLYQVATAELSPADIAVPIRSIVGKNKNCKVTLGTVVDVDRAAKTVTLANGDCHSYDSLVLACGSRHSYFGHDDWEPFAPGLKTLEQATEIRRRILFAFEQAENETDPQIQKAWQTFAIVGGGPAGVELAGAVSEVSQFMVTRDFKNIKAANTRIVLIEAGPKLLSAFPDSLSEVAKSDLERLGVEVVTQTPVTHIDADGVALGQIHLPAKTAIWSAGVLPSPLGKRLNTPLDRSGRVIVNEFLNLPDDASVFVIGDMAYARQDNQPLPGLAPVAIQQGKYVARRLAKASPLTRFHYVDKGIMATIGAKRAVLKVRKLELHGLPAWLAWVFVHLFFLIGFRNRVVVMFEWAWEYLTFRRGARLILSKSWRENPTASELPNQAKPGV